MCPVAPSHIMSEAPHQGCTSHAHSVKTVNLSVTGQARVRSDGRTMWLLEAGAGKAGACQVGGLWIAFDKGTDGADRLRRVGGRTAGQGLRLHSTAWNALPLLLLSRCRRAPASIVKSQRGVVYARSLHRARITGARQISDHQTGRRPVVIQCRLAVVTGLHLRG